MAKPVYALVGADSFMQVERLADVLAEVGGDAQRTDVDGERAELSEVLDELRSFAMFGGARVVVVRNGDAFLTRFRQQLEDYLNAPSGSSSLVLRLNSLPSNQRIYKSIAKVGRIDDCNPPKLKDLPAWLQRRAQAGHGVTLSADAAALLADLIGDDMGRLDSELAKLALSAEGGRVGPEKIGATVAFQREREMRDMTDQLAAGHTAEALRRWRQLLHSDPSAEFRAVTWLGMWLENVRKALALKKTGLNAFAIATQLRVWPREAQGPFMKTVDALGAAGAARALDLLTEVDHQSKSGVGDAAANVERFILEMGTLSANATRGGRSLPRL